MDELNIALASDSEAEQRVKALLLDTLRQYDLTPWLFTRQVNIDAMAETNFASIRDGVPQITLRTGFRSVYGLLSLFIHEQLHVHLHRHQAQVDQAVEELKTIYPSVPVGGNDGAMTEKSTYEHLLLCTLERDAVKEILGDDLGSKLKPRGYHFIYNEVEHHGDRLRDIITRHSLSAKD